MEYGEGTCNYNPNVKEITRKMPAKIVVGGSLDLTLAGDRLANDQLGIKYFHFW